MKDIFVIFIIFVDRDFFLVDFNFWNIMMGVNVDNVVNVDCVRVIGEKILFLMMGKLVIDYMFKCSF